MYFFTFILLHLLINKTTMKKVNLNSTTLKKISNFFVALASISQILIIAFNWKTWIEHPSVSGLSVIILIIGSILSIIATNKKKAEDLNSTK